MSGSFILSCESTVDFPFDYMKKRDIPVLHYTYAFGDRVCVDSMGKDPDELPALHRNLAEGNCPTTTQINEIRYTEFLEELLRRGDVLHITFGTGMTQSYQNAVMAAEELREKYPDRKLVVIDSLCSSAGYGMLVDYAADMRDAGKTLDETQQWVMEHRQRIHHQFYSTDLKFFKRTGRVSGPEATLGAILNICPLMRLNDEGRIVAYGKIRGEKNAIKEMAAQMELHAENGPEYDGKCLIVQSECMESAEKLRKLIVERFRNLKEDSIKILDIGAIIASHSGPGTVAVFFMGDERQPSEEK